MKHKIIKPILRAPAKDGIKPVWDKDCEVLIIGSITSVDGMKMGFLYGSRSNQFWQLLDYCLSIDPNSTESFSYLKKLLVDNYKKTENRQILEENKEKIRTMFCKQLLKHHIAICDVFEECFFNGNGSADNDIILNNSNFPFKTYKNLLTKIINSSNIKKVIVNSNFVEKQFLSMNISGNYTLENVPTPVQRYMRMEEKQKIWSEVFNK